MSSMNVEAAGVAVQSVEVAARAADALMVRDTCGVYRVASDGEVLHQARRVLECQIRRGRAFDSPQQVKDYLSVQLGALEHEVFMVMFVDAQHRLIACEPMFRGTLTQTSVYPREVVKRALALNASAVVLAHNHPSGSVQPSRSDELLTQVLKNALQLVDVRVLDHIVVAGNETMSFAQRGLL